MDEFTWCPQVGTAGEVSQSRVITQYGDGYSAAAALGINNRVARWSLSFTGTLTLMNEIRNFLDNRRGVRAFTWTPPASQQGMWRSEPYSITSLGNNLFTLTVEFQQVFHP